MGKHFDEELKDLNNDILKMGVFAEEAIYKSVEALKNGDENMGLEISLELINLTIVENIKKT